MTGLTLDRASTIIDAALRKGREMKFAPLSVAVLDAGGHLIAFKREDRSGIMRFDIAFGKAWGALGMGFGSRELAVRATATPAFVAALSAVSGGRVVPCHVTVSFEVWLRPGDSARRPAGPSRRFIVCLNERCASACGYLHDHFLRHQIL